MVGEPLCAQCFDYESMVVWNALAPELWRRTRDWEPITEPVSTAPLVFRTPEPLSEGGMCNAGDAADGLPEAARLLGGIDVLVVDDFKLGSAKTKEFVSALAALELTGTALIVAQADKNLTLASRNVPNVPQDFDVVLTDASGFSVPVSVSSVSNALYFPPGETIVVPKIVLSTVRIPLSAFRRVNLNAVTSVSFRFDQKLQGNVLIDDVAFASTP